MSIVRGILYVDYNNPRKWNLWLHLPKGDESGIPNLGSMVWNIFLFFIIWKYKIKFNLWITFYKETQKYSDALRTLFNK
jgi:hypothetical protein